MTPPKMTGISSLENNELTSPSSDFLDVDIELSRLLGLYAATGEPIQVNFRKLVSWVPYSDSYTHYIHQYPAKLLKHIPIFFLRSKILLPNENSTILDPFSGSGTVLLEALLSNNFAIGCDANPLARLIARVKTTPINPLLLYPLSTQIIKRAKQFRKVIPRNITNIDLWFPSHVQKNLSRIDRAIEEIEDDKLREFFEIVFSSIVKKASYADKNLSVPVRVKPEKHSNELQRTKAEKHLSDVSKIDVFELFNKHCISNIKRMEKLYKANIQTTASIISDDARNFILNNNLESNLQETVDLIITSPPYGGAQKYIRSSSLSLGWLKYCEEKSLRFYEKQNIGREHYPVNEYTSLTVTGINVIDDMLSEIRKTNPLRAHISGNYLLEMEVALTEMYKALKYDAYCVLVIGNNEVCSLQFETQKYMRLLAERIGFTISLELIDDIQSRGLMTKRNKSASIINSEWVLVFKK